MDQISEDAKKRIADKMKEIFGESSSNEMWIITFLIMLLFLENGSIPSDKFEKLSELAKLLEKELPQKDS